MVEEELKLDPTQREENWWVAGKETQREGVLLELQLEAWPWGPKLALGQQPERSRRQIESPGTTQMRLTWC